MISYRSFTDQFGAGEVFGQDAFEPFVFFLNGAHEISLNYEKTYSSESTILTEKLNELYGITVGKHGKTSIRLTKLPETVVPANEEYYQLSIKDNTISIQANTTHAMNAMDALGLINVS